MSTKNTDVEDVELVEEANDNLLEEQTKESINNFIAEATKEGICSFSMYQLKADHPKAYAKFEEFLSSKFPAGSEIFDENNKLAEDYVISVLLYNPLPPVMNFLDSNEQYLNVTGAGKAWHTSVNGNESAETFESRTHAQVSGINDCFAALEQTL